MTETKGASALILWHSEHVRKCLLAASVGSLAGLDWLAFAQQLRRFGGSMALSLRLLSRFLQLLVFFRQSRQLVFSELQLRVCEGQASSKVLTSLRAE